MLNKTILAAFLATSALAFGIEPDVARRMAEDKIECPAPDTRADPSTACTRGRISTATE